MVLYNIATVKIAISGAHRVGKTTLAEGLLKHLPAYVLTMEPFYELEESGYISSEVPDVEDFITQFHYSVDQLSGDEQNIIFDRCPLDILAYVHAIDPGRNIQSLFDTAQTIIEEIDLLVFVPIEEPDLIFCQESDLPELRYKVNEVLINWVEGLQTNIIEVNGTILNRRNQVINKIRDHINKQGPKT